MRKLALLLLALLPVATASAAEPSPLVLYSGPTIAQPNGDVVVQRLDGSGRVSLTGGAGDAGGPVWSPDGSRVAFSSNAATNAKGPGELYVARADGSDVHAVTTGTPAGSTRFSPTWSPDGTELAYLQRSSAFGPADISIVSADGGTPPRRITSDAGDKRSVAWQPHGSLLLFDRDDPSASTTTLWTFDSSTGREREIGNGVATGAALSGDWSPDGSQLAFPDRSGHLAVAAADGSGLHELSSLQMVGTVAWSPDGNAIALAAQHILPGPIDKVGPPAAIDIFVVNTATGTARRLTGPFDFGNPGARNVLPSWSSDGSRLLFRADGYDGLPVARQMNADGTCETPVPLGVDVPVTLAFQPGVTGALGPMSCVDLRVRATTVDAKVAPRRQARIQVVVENDGNEPATSVDLAIQQAGRASGFVEGGSLGTIASGEERAVTGSLVSPDVGVATATVVATADETDSTPTNARATVETTVLNCTLVGTPGGDLLVGTAGRDRICGLPGPDHIVGGKGNDYIDAGNGDDTIIPGPGNDTVLARGGRDVIYARDGVRDWIDCGTEYDIAIVDRVDHTSHCEKVVRR
jgi:dipeptidyl aminopeptidase/acylaminoacyl peptidase